MQRSDLKKLIKECLVEILSEDFIKKTIKEQISEKIVIEMNTSKATSDVPKRKKIQESKKTNSGLTHEQRERARKIIAGDDDESVDDQIALNPRTLDAINKIENPMFKELAEDTVERTSSAVEQKTRFTEEESKLIDFDKIAAISEALPK